MIRTEEVQRVCCDRCSVEMPSRRRTFDEQYARAIRIFRAANPLSPVDEEDLCPRCVTRIDALADEQIRTQPRRGRTKAWSEAVPQGPDAEKVKP